MKLLLHTLMIFFGSLMAAGLMALGELQWRFGPGAGGGDPALVVAGSE